MTCVVVCVLCRDVCCGVCLVMYDVCCVTGADLAQFGFLRTLLQQKNGALLFLKFLNQDLAASCMKCSELPELTYVSLSHPCSWLELQRV